MARIETSKKPRTVFPLIRHLSARITPWLLKTPVSANQITFISMNLGLLASLLFALGDFTTSLYASIVFFFTYLLDHCDGEVARAKNQTSRFGQMYDSFVDWIFHTAFFMGLSWGTYSTSDDLVWVWFGLAAALGATINYLLSIYIFIRKSQKNTSATEYGEDPEENYDQPGNWIEAVTFVFRELVRADFWLLVLLLAVFDIVWVLLPAAAFGAQAYWIAQLLAWDKNYRV